MKQQSSLLSHILIPCWSSCYGPHVKNIEGKYLLGLVKQCLICCICDVKIRLFLRLITSKRSINNDVFKCHPSNDRNQFLDATGGNDGSVRMFEFGHPEQIVSFRGPNVHDRVNRIRFNSLGNKVCLILVLLLFSIPSFISLSVAAMSLNFVT